MRENLSTSQSDQYVSNAGSIDSASASSVDQERDGNPAADEPQIYDIEDVPAHAQSDCNSSDAVKPYAVEEPEEDTTTEQKGPSPLQQGQPRYWEELVDSMGELYCDSDSSPGIMSSARGRKRKPATKSGLSQFGQHPKSASVPDTQYERPSLSPKRPRKKDESSRKTQRSLKKAQKERVRKARGLSGSSTTSFSTDASGFDLAGEPPASEPMELD